MVPCEKRKNNRGMSAKDKPLKDGTVVKGLFKTFKYNKKIKVTNNDKKSVGYGYRNHRKK